jgi:putative redox protein
LIADEPEDLGGRDAGPTPQELLALSLASCTAITVEMYAERKGWDVGLLEVEAGYESDAKGGCSRFDVVMKLPPELSDEQVDQLRAISSRCPVHRALVGEVEISDRVERIGL